MRRLLKLRFVFSMHFLSILLKICTLYMARNLVREKDYEGDEWKKNDLGFVFIQTETSQGIVKVKRLVRTFKKLQKREEGSGYFCILPIQTLILRISRKNAQRENQVGVLWSSVMVTGPNPPQCRVQNFKDTIRDLSNRRSFPGVESQVILARVLMLCTFGREEEQPMRLLGRQTQDLFSCQLILGW